MTGALQVSAWVAVPVIVAPSCVMLAVMSTTPGATQVARPPAAIVAKLMLDELQVTEAVRFSIEASA